jgi:hypothetical protein
LQAKQESEALQGKPWFSSAAGCEAKKAPSKKTRALSVRYAIDLRYNIGKTGDYCLRLLLAKGGGNPHSLQHKDP